MSAMLDDAIALRYDPDMRSVAKILLAGVVSAASLLAAGQPYCAFEVKVSSASGAARGGVPVAEVRNRQNMFADSMTNANGVARICNAPLETVDIAAGFDVCGLVMIRNLHPKWPKTIKLFVMFEENACEHFALSESVRSCCASRTIMASHCPESVSFRQIREAAQEQIYQMGSGGSFGS
jgi:hypothetical protein